MKTHCPTPLVPQPLWCFPFTWQLLVPLGRDSSHDDISLIQQQWNLVQHEQMFLPQQQLNKLNKLSGLFPAQLIASSKVNAVPSPRTAPWRHVSELGCAEGQGTWLCLLSGGMRVSSRCPRDITLRRPGEWLGVLVPSIPQLSCCPRRVRHFRTL